MYTSVSEKLLIKAQVHSFEVYTRWRNLKKTADMDVGAIGFHDSSKVKKVRIEKDAVIVKQINKTKEVVNDSSSFLNY